MHRPVGMVAAGGCTLRPGKERLPDPSAGEGKGGAEGGPWATMACAPPHVLVILKRSDAALVDRVVELVNLCYRGEGSWTGEREIVSGQRISRDQLLADLAEDGCEVLVAVPPGQQPPQSVLACVKTGKTASTVVGPVAGPPAAYLGMLAVRPELQSRGLGGILIRSVEERAAAVHRCERVVLDVLDCRRELLAWYARLGYEATGKLRPAAPFMREKGERLLVAASFVLLEKRLHVKS
jgi:ribosomal protein S18 acetylase RimI-like enzyme